MTDPASWSTESVQQAAALLSERVRAGELRREDLTLAAFCEHAPALLAVGGIQARPDELKEWGDALADWGRETSVRALVAAARGVLPAWRCFRPQDDRPLRAILLAEAWVVEPTEDRAREAWEFAAPTLFELTEETTRFACSSAPWAERGLAASASHALAACAWAARMTLARREPDHRVGDPLLLAAGALGVDAPDEDGLRTQVAAELIPWALGTHDPLSERRQPPRT